MTRVVYQCTNRLCGLKTPYKPGRCERFCAACDAPLTSRIERDPVSVNAWRDSVVDTVNAPPVKVLVSVFDQIAKIQGQD